MSTLVTIVITVILQLVASTSGGKYDIHEIKWQCGVYEWLRTKILSRWLQYWTCSPFVADILLSCEAVRWELLIWVVPVVLNARLKEEWTVEYVELDDMLSLSLLSSTLLSSPKTPETAFPETKKQKQNFNFSNSWYWKTEPDNSSRLY